MIPITTTTITVLRSPPPDSGEEQYNDPTEAQPDFIPIAEHVRAVISAPFGRERNMGGAQSIVEFSLSCDPTDIDRLDRVLNEQTGKVYEVTWAEPRVGFGLEHTRAGLKQVEGFA